jgi:hypothetical protein
MEERLEVIIISVTRSQKCTQRRWIKYLLMPILILPLIQCSHGLWRPQTQEAGVSVQISYQSLHAKKVCISGDFNHWSPQADCLVNKGKDWSIELWLTPGRYQYLFVIDDRLWEPDPTAPLREDSGFGTENSVLIVD